MDQSVITVQADPAVPLEVTSTRLLDRSERGITFELTMTNRSAQSVLAYALRYEHVDASTGHVSGGRDSRFFAPTRELMLPPGGVRTSTVTVRPADAVRVIVDFVALADGTAYGWTRTNMLAESQSALLAQHLLLTDLLKRAEAQTSVSDMVQVIRSEMEAKPAVLRHVPPSAAALPPQR